MWLIKPQMFTIQLFYRQNMTASVSDDSVSWKSVKTES